MRAVVDDFNRSQDRIWVEFSSTSHINRKLMLSIGGGVPPDVAGLFGNTLAVYAENNALTPLDRLAREAGIHGEDYVPIFWDICHHLGHLWALPSSPACLGLVWNKRIFRENGLDPDRPPASIRELEQINDRLVRRDAQGRLQSIGHLPSEPGWWPAIWGWWFGGDLWDGKRITPEFSGKPCGHGLDLHLPPPLSEPGTSQLSRWFWKFRFSAKRFFHRACGHGFAGSMDSHIYREIRAPGI
jgi:ABC-type glycerol-3-phosphate transport system substrate-binding protein